MLLLSSRHILLNVVWNLPWVKFRRFYSWTSIKRGFFIGLLVWERTAAEQRSQNGRGSGASHRNDQRFADDDGRTRSGGEDSSGHPCHHWRWSGTRAGKTTTCYSRAACWLKIVFNLIFFLWHSMCVHAHLVDVDVLWFILLQSVGDPLPEQ